MEKLGGRRFENVDASSLTQRFEKDAARFAYRNPETAEWFRRFFADIDLNQLQDIYAGYARRSGVSMEHFNTVSNVPFLVVPRWAENSDAQYSVENNIVRINGDYLRDYYKAVPEGQISLFENIVHELVHATGGNKEYDADDGSWRIRFGFVDEEGNVEDGELLFNALNEGMTELIARDATYEYLSRSPLQLPSGTVLNASAFQEYLGRGEESYEYELAFTRELINYLAKACELPYQTMEDAFVRSYYEGTGLLSEEAHELLTELLGRDFLKELSKADGPKDLRPLFTALHGRPLDKQLLYRIRKFLRLN